MQFQPKVITEYKAAEISSYKLYLGHTVKRLARCPYPATYDVLPVAAKEWKLHARITHQL